MNTVEIKARSIAASIMDPHVSYLRTGRKKRASGKVVGIDSRTGLTKVKPARDDWKHIHVTDDEIAAGREKPPVKPRKKDEFGPVKPRGPRKKKEPVYKPMKDWEFLVSCLRQAFDAGNKQVHLFNDAADEIERANRKLEEFLPLKL